MNTYFIELLNHNGAETCVKYSTITKKYYVSTTAEMKERNFLIGFAEHEDTIEKAIESFNKRIHGNLIVINAYGKERKEIIIPTEKLN